MQVWFYKAEYGNWVSKLIAWWTSGIHSHCEIMFSDGIAFSSSERDGGVRFKEGITNDTGHWDIVDIPGVMVEDQAKIKEWCSTQVGKDYDWKAIFGYLKDKQSSQDQKKWYCSEITLFTLRRFGLYGGQVRLHPSAAYEALREQYS